jgi:hypothetical protein
MCPVYLGLRRMLCTVSVQAPAPAGGGYRAGSAFSLAAMVGTPSLPPVRQVKIASMAGAVTGALTSRVLVRPWLALSGLGCGWRSAA